MANPLSEFALATGLPLPLVVGVVAAMLLAVRYAVIAGGALGLVTMFANALAPLRIQKIPFSSAQLWREIGYSMLTVVIFGIMAAAIVWLTGGLLNPTVPSTTAEWLWAGFMVPVALLLHDFYFYWMHRAVHLPKIYPLVHRVHHLSTNPSALSAFAFHPLEAILEAAGVIAIIAVLPMPAPSLIAFGLLAFVFNVMGHLGYELAPKSFLVSSVGCWLNSATSHNTHHRKFRVNYGLYTLIWDRLFGTIDAKFEAEIMRAPAKHI